VFPRVYLDLPQPHGDVTMHQVLRNSAEVLLREREAESVAERVRAILRYEPDVAHVDVRRIATQLGMNVRALRRRLGAEQSPLSNCSTRPAPGRAHRAAQARCIDQGGRPRPRLLRGQRLPPRLQALERTDAGAVRQTGD
jgi:hypothetical protein